MDGTARVEPGGGSPDPAGWSAINDPEARLRTALGEVYSSYGRAESMLARAEQEAPANPIPTDVLAPYAAAWDRMRDVLTEGWRGGGDIVMRAAVGHAVAFAR